MKTLYSRFGRCCSIDMTFSLINDKFRSESGKFKSFTIGFLAGRSSTLKPVIFGLLISLFQTKQVFLSFFTEIFEYLGAWPENIMSDQDRSVTFALKQLRQKGFYHGAHLYDAWHTLKLITCRENFKSLIRDLLFSKDLKEYNYQYNKGLQMAG